MRGHTSPRLRPDTPSYQQVARLRLKGMEGLKVKDVDKARVKGFSATWCQRLRTEHHQPGHVRPDGRYGARGRQRLQCGYPCRGVRKRGKKGAPVAILGHAQAAILAAAMPQPWALVVGLAMHGGLRAGEVAGLQVQHFNPLRHSVTIEQTIAEVGGRIVVDVPKSDAAYRTVDELPADLVAALAEQVQGWPANAYLFGSGNGERYNSDKFAFVPSNQPYRHNRFYSQVWLPTVRGLGLSLRFHDLRHYHASALLDAALPLLYCAKRLGHSNPASSSAPTATFSRAKGQGCRPAGCQARSRSRVCRTAQGGSVAAGR